MPSDLFIHPKDGQDGGIALTILAAEPDFYPDNLWDQAPEDGSKSGGSRWWCLHTKPRQEKAVARDLRSAKVGFYLPLMVSESRTPRGRKLQSVIPVFTGYVFLKGDENARLEALRGNRLANVLEVFDQDTLENDLRRLRKLLTSGLPLVSEPSVQPGMIVRIKSGPLTGLQGTVIRRGNCDHFVATVEFLSQGASVHLQDWQVEPVIGQMGLADRAG
ncbi:Transcription antitermination protein RfaH [Aquisphaera giovannonii]|uniref:Transcription antitermination protein RfaH n=1 Tax=Aquisphaera giovannonii TaxID=406548 RepID=A0A5B9W2K2_9BACT|nr:transcription termination/antitermination NusG family protein [Aquisphaera giovannonii]QEH34808.1 Transcription antitermination protein RfaH [Aquisphaera giovannonii]